MTKSPCKNCLDRKIPKTCEKDCIKWKEFKEIHEKEREKYFLERKTENFCCEKYNRDLRRR